MGGVTTKGLLQGLRLLALFENEAIKTNRDPNAIKRRHVK